MLMDIECNTPKEVEQIKKDNQTQPKKDNRFIAKMVSTVLISAGILCVGTGAALGCVAQNENPDDLTNNAKYIASVYSISAGAVSSSIGVGVLAGIKSVEKDEEKCKTSEL